MAADPAFLVLHGLRLKGFADEAALADLARLEEREVKHALGDLEAAGLARYREGRISGWALSAEGRARHRDQVAEELAACGRRDDIDRGYRRFLALNDTLKQVCTDWQLREGALNDHRDVAYDRAVVERLVQLDRDVQPVCAALADALARFGSYGPRLARAAERVGAGDHEWFTGVTIDSYHTVWFQLHEDLLVTLAIERSEGET